MKKVSKVGFIAAVFFCAGASQANILMDYDDAANGHHAVHHGGFEYDEITGKDISFGTLKKKNAEWVEVSGKPDKTNALKTDLCHPENGGERTAVISKNRVLAQQLDCTFQEGMELNVSFMWKGMSFETGKASEQFNMVFYYDDAEGAHHDVFSLSSGPCLGNKEADTWKTVEGKNIKLSDLQQRDLLQREDTPALWVRFETGSKHFARLDNVYIEAVPEPATLGMLGLFGGLLFWMRRRKVRA